MCVGSVMGESRITLCCLLIFQLGRREGGRLEAWGWKNEREVGLASWMRSRGESERET